MIRHNPLAAALVLHTAAEVADWEAREVTAEAAWDAADELAPYRPRPFGAWLLDQTHRADPIGDLARDVAAGCWCPGCTTRNPAEWTVDDARQDLDDHDADPAALDALARAIADWGNPA